MEKIKEYVKGLLAKEYSGHDYYHCIRVYNNAMLICKDMDCDKQLVSVASLLHDVDDAKLFNSKDYYNARKILNDLNYEKDFIEKVINIIKAVSFKGKDSVIPSSLEGKIVQDADRLDAIGAIGIARTFAYGGNHNRLIYDPSVKPNLNMDYNQYKNANNPTINHFYEKLLLLKDMMNLDVSKQIAKKRHEFLLLFLKQFNDECYLSSDK